MKPGGRFAVTVLPLQYAGQYYVLNTQMGSAAQSRMHAQALLGSKNEAHAECPVVCLQQTCVHQQTWWVASSCADGRRSRDNTRCAISTRLCLPRTQVNHRGIMLGIDYSVDKRTLAVRDQTCAHATALTETRLIACLPVACLLVAISLWCSRVQPWCTQGRPLSDWRPLAEVSRSST